MPPLHGKAVAVDGWSLLIIWNLLAFYTTNTKRKAMEYISISGILYLLGSATMVRDGQNDHIKLKLN